MYARSLYGSSTGISKSPRTSLLLFQENIQLHKAPIVCVSDGETGIINAMTRAPTFADVQCWNHVVNDIQRWVSDNGFSEADITAYKDHVRYILGRDSMENTLTAIDELKQGWDEFF